MHKCTCTSNYTNVTLLGEFRGILVLFTSDDVYEVICEDKGDPFSLDSKFALEISQEVAKIDVNKLESIHVQA